MRREKEEINGDRRKKGGNELEMRGKEERRRYKKEKT